MSGDPRLDHGDELLAGVPAAGIALEVETGLDLDLPEGVREATRRRQRIDMAIREDADHHEAAILRAEIAAEGAEDLVAEARPVDVVHDRFADVAQRRRGRERHVLQRQHDLLPLPRHAAMALGGQKREGAGIGGGQIPGWTDRVHRSFMADRAGDHGEAGNGVHRVVDMGRTVARTDDVQRDQVGALHRQLLVGEPASRRHVGGENARALTRRGDQRREQLAAAWIAQIDGDRALALVEAGPVDRAAILRDRPALIVETALDVVEADHVGAHLGERHAAQRRSDECRAFDDAEARENACHVRFPCLGSLSRASLFAPERVLALL